MLTGPSFWYHAKVEDLDHITARRASLVTEPELNRQEAWNISQGLSAAAGLDLQFAQWAPQVKGDKLDNPDDLKAIEDGFNAYLRENN